LKSVAYDEIDFRLFFQETANGVAHDGDVIRQQYFDGHATSGVKK
jgi:hypothetical protein